ncbi:GPI-N-acetylgalactosamine transferase PGAP4-like [Glandiceps talaboti]
MKQYNSIVSNGKYKLTNGIHTSRSKNRYIYSLCIDCTTRLWRALTFRSWQYIIITLVIFVVTFFIVLPLCCRSLPYSFYFKADWDRDFEAAIQWNEERIVEAETYFQTLNPERTLRNNADVEENIHIVFGVITLDRTKHHKVDSSQKYLTQVLADIDRSIQLHKPEHINKLFICNVNPDPSKHSEALELSKYFPMIDDSATNVKDDRTKLTKEKDDYAFCLNHAMTYKSKYVMIVQDDAIPNEGYYEILHDLLENKLEKRVVRDDIVMADGKWAYIKLNFPLYLASFDADWSFFLEGVSMSLIAATIVTFVYCLFHCQNQKYYIFSAYYVFITSFVYFLILLLLISRQYFLLLRGMSKWFYEIRPGSNCCTAAVLYPSAVIPDIIKYLIETNFDPKYPVDFALNDFARISSLQQYVTVPNLFTHIGMVSSLHLDSLRPVAFYTP